MYRRFESFVAFVLTIVIGAIILVALFRLIISVADTLVLRTLNPLQHEVFQRVFGEVMTLLIALEFNHTLRYVVSGERGIIHTGLGRTVKRIVTLEPATRLRAPASPPAYFAACRRTEFSRTGCVW